MLHLHIKELEDALTGDGDPKAARRAVASAVMAQGIWPHKIEGDPKSGPADLSDEQLLELARSLA